MRRSPRDTILLRHGLRADPVPTVSVKRLPGSDHPVIAVTRDGGPLLLTVGGAVELAESLENVREKELAHRIRVAVKEAQGES